MQRDTRQRRALRRVFEEVEGPLSPQEALAVAQQHVPGVSIATVYRTLKALVEDGVLEAVTLPGQVPRYELAGKSHHHHFHCRACGKVYELTRCCPDVASLAPEGFAVAEHEIILSGSCRDCLREVIS